jgi:hypothetical protein
LEKTEKTLQKEKALLLEQYKRVKKLERQGKRREARIENAQQNFQQQANEHFSVVYTTLQLGLKAQPSPQSPPVVCQADVNTKASARRSISSEVPLPLRLAPLQAPPPPGIFQQRSISMPRIPVLPSKRPTSLLMFGKPNSSLDVTEFPSVNNSVIFPATPRPSSLSNEEKVIDASSINHCNTTSTGPSLVPLSAKQQASEVVTTTSVVSVLQGNDICRLNALPPSCL